MHEYTVLTCKPVSRAVSWLMAIFNKASVQPCGTKAFLPCHFQAGEASTQLYQSDFELI